MNPTLKKNGRFSGGGAPERKKVSAAPAASRLLRGLWAALPASILFACSSGSENAAADFSRPQPLEASDSIEIRQILSPLGWSISGDKAVVLSDKTDTLFYVYRLPEFRYLYCFGQKGQGPDDFSFAFLRNLEPATPERFNVEDIQKDTRHSFRLGEKAAQKIASETFPTYGCLLAVNDSVFLQFRMRHSDCTGNLAHYFRTVSSRSEALDSIIPPVYSNVFKMVRFSDGGMGMSGNHYNVPRQAYRDGRLVLFFGDVRRTDVYDIAPDGRFVLTASMGDRSTEEQINAMGLENVQEGESIVSCCPTDENIYVLTVDYRKRQDSDSRDLLRSYIEVYDWDGQPLRKYALGRAFNCFLVDPLHGKAYCYDNHLDFDRVFVYDIPK